MARAQLRDFDFLPTKFGGTHTQDPLAHWLSYTDYCDIHTYDDAQRLAKFRLTVVDDARLWIEGKVFATPLAMRDAFLARFSATPTREGALSAFRNATLNPGENIEKFVARLRRMAQQIGYDDEQFIRDQLLTGLPASVRTAVVMANANTLHAAVISAQRFLDCQGGQAMPREVAFAIQSSPSTEVRMLTDQIAALMSENKALSSGVRETRATGATYAPKSVRTRAPTPHSNSRSNSLSPGRNYSRSSSNERGRQSDQRDKGKYSDRRYSRERDVSRGKSGNVGRERRFSRDGRGSSYDRKRGFSNDRKGSDARPGREKNGRCYFCDAYGHFFADCKKRKDEIRLMVSDGISEHAVIKSKGDENLA